MPLLEKSPTQDLKRLLQAFPAATLKDSWAIRGTKEEICFGAAEERDIDKITSFMLKNIGRCRLHTYVFEAHADGTLLEQSIEAAEIVAKDGEQRTLLMCRAEFTVYLKDPIEEQTVAFLWPMRIESVNDYTVLTMVVLERNPCAYFDRDCYQLSRSLDERGILQRIEKAGFQRADLHKGVKSLWEADFMDSFRTRFKKPKSTAMEHMDEEQGIKKNNPELYEQLQTSVMFVTNFQVADSGSGVEDFIVDPSAGFIGFSRYTEGAGDADEVVHRLLEQNR